MSEVKPEAKVVSLAEQERQKSILEEDPYDFEEQVFKNANGARVYGFAIIIAGAVTFASVVPVLAGTTTLFFPFSFIFYFNFFVNVFV